MIAYFCHIYTRKYNLQLFAEESQQSTDLVHILVPFKNWKVCYFADLRNAAIAIGSNLHLVDFPPQMQPVFYTASNTNL